MNQDIRLDQVIGRLTAFSNVNQTLLNNVNTPIIYQNVIEDNVRSFITNQTDIVIRTGINRVKFNVKSVFDAQAVAVGLRIFSLFVNGFSITGAYPTKGLTDVLINIPPINNYVVTGLYTSYWIPCNVNDVFNVIARQTSGGNLDILTNSIVTAEFAVV